MSTLLNTERFKLAESFPATYTEEDPYDLTGKQPLFDRLQRNWWELPEEQKQLAIANAFRSTLISPQLELKWNAVAYQALMEIPPGETDPQVYEDYLRDWKRKYDMPGQLDLGGGEGFATEEVLPGERMNPPFWRNVRNLGQLAPYIEELTRAAEEDLAAGGKGFIFRETAMRIPGIGPKIASFAWLILMPTTSDLAAIDLWMARHLGVSKVPTDDRYFELEDQLRKERDQLYPGVPLSQYQWAVWDFLRTHGFHQPHDPFAVVDPTPFQQVKWEGPSAIERALKVRERSGPPIPGQLNLGKWKRVPMWATPWRFPRYGQEGYTIYGQTAGTVGVAQGVAVRPDRQSREEILAILSGMPGHREDYQRQRELIPDWAINRGGKVAQQFLPGPGGVGVTYVPGAIVVSEWVDVNDNWLLYHDRVSGIIAQKGGRTSHGVVVARERSIPIVLASDAASINPGDTLVMDGSRGTVAVNGGGGQQEDYVPEEATEAVIAWVWSKGSGMYQNIPPGSEGAAALHRPMMMEMAQAGRWDRRDSAFGVIYPDGRVEMVGTPSDMAAMTEWLRSLYDITAIQELAHARR